jgi:hypothetical protein
MRKHPMLVVMKSKGHILFMMLLLLLLVITLIEPYKTLNRIFGKI